MCICRSRLEWKRAIQERVPVPPKMVKDGLGRLGHNYRGTDVTEPVKPEGFGGVQQNVQAVAQVAPATHTSVHFCLIALRAATL